MKKAKFKMMRKPSFPVRKPIVKTTYLYESTLYLKDLYERFPFGTLVINNASYGESFEIEIYISEEFQEDDAAFNERVAAYEKKLAEYNKWYEDNKEIILESIEKNKDKRVNVLTKEISQLELKQKKLEKESIRLILSKKKELEKLKSIQQNDEKK